LGRFHENSGNAANALPRLTFQEYRAARSQGGLQPKCAAINLTENG
jgi:hypothetical protein